MAVLGLIGSLLMYFGANTLIVWFNWPQDAYYSIIALSFAPFFVALLSAVRRFFQGMQRMTYSSASQIIEQIARVAVGIALAVVLTRKLGVVYGAAGATFGAVAGAIVALVYMYVSFFMFRKKQADLLSQQVEETDENNKVVMKTLIMLAIPLQSVGS
jgi:stage V sporulation protein B